MTRFPTDETNETIVPLAGERGVQVRYPHDLTVDEWNAVTDAVLQQVHKIESEASDERSEERPEGGDVGSGQWWA